MEVEVKEWVALVQSAAGRRIAYKLVRISSEGINCPDVKLDVPAVTEKDAKDLKFIWQQRIDYAAMSFVQRKADVEDLRGYMEKYRAEELAALGGKPAHAPDDVRIEVSDGKLRVNPETWRPLIISKIETPGAIDDIDNILEASDGIMVARGDLGVELSLESVPIAQKNLIDKANRAGKPVITATQMLESMISAPVPTRAEVSDVANAVGREEQSFFALPSNLIFSSFFAQPSNLESSLQVYDGTDAVMLSGEAAVGQYPVETVKMMATVCQASEQAHSYARTIPKVNPIVTSGWTHTAEPTVPEDFRHAIADGAIAIGTQARADAVMTLTTTGDLAALISKRRPTVPIIAATGSPAALFRMTLLYGVVPIYCRTLARVHDTSPEERSATLDRTQSASAVSGLAPTQIDPHHSLRTLLPSTDTVLAEVEKEARGMLKDKAIVVTASGYVHGLPGLSEICKLSRFGDATSGFLLVLSGPRLSILTSVSIGRRCSNPQEPSAPAHTGATPTLPSSNAARLPTPSPAATPPTSSAEEARRRINWSAAQSQSPIPRISHRSMPQQALDL